MNAACLSAQGPSARSPADIILVAGPSAAGKTTFIQHLTAGRLPVPLRGMFPDGLDRWAKLEGNVFVKRGASVASESILPNIPQGAGLIVHYDTVLIRRYGISSYHDDPVFVLLSRAQALIIVNISPPLPVLKSQFDARQSRMAREKGWLKSTWRTVVRMPLRPLRFRLRRAASKTADIYRNMDYIANSYREWNDFAASLVRATPNARMLNVERRTSDVGETFVLAEGDKHRSIVRGAGL